MLLDEIRRIHGESREASHQPPMAVACGRLAPDRAYVIGGEDLEDGSVGTIVLVHYGVPNIEQELRRLGQRVNHKS